MQIVINISEETYQKIKNDEYTDVERYCGMLSIANGTPLPKGHGFLKDVDNIKTAFPNGEYVRTESVKATIDHEETIIEADKESEE